MRKRFFYNTRSLIFHSEFFILIISNQGDFSNHLSYENCGISEVSPFTTTGVIENI